MSKKLLKSTAVVGSFTLLSRLFGFLRDIILAQVFGAGAAFDAYLVAFKIPNFLRRLFADGALSQALVPVLSASHAEKSPEEVREFIQRMMGSLGLVVLLLVGIVEILSPWIVLIFAPGFFDDPTRFTLASHMLRITFPYLFFISLIALSGAVLNTFHRFSLPAFTPVLLNITLISVAWWWAPNTTQPIYTLAWGVMLGGVLQLLIQLPALYRLKMLSWPKLGFRHSGVLRVMKLMVPALFGVSVVQISLLVDNVFASFLPAGSISWLYYSNRLVYFPVGVISVALATVVMPYLSRDHAKQSGERFSATMDWALRWVLLLGVPAAVGLLMLAGPMLATLIQHGAFTNRDVIMTRESLWAFAVGVPAFMLIKVLASGFYAKQNIRTPVKVAAIATATNIIFNAALILPLAHAGLALATSLSSILNAGLLFYLLVHNKIYQPRAGWGRLLLRISVAVIFMGLALWYFSPHINAWLAWDLAARVWHLSLLIALGSGIYFACLWISGLRWLSLQPPRVDA